MSNQYPITSCKSLPKNYTPAHSLLTHVGDSEQRNSSGYKAFQVYDCACGKRNLILIHTNVRRGHTLSCGCFQQKRISDTRKTHGQSTTREYKIWAGIVNRCTNSNSTIYLYYGGKGISISDSWRDFKQFFVDMGACPPNSSIDRIDSSGNYCQENCRWATDLEQANNTSRNVFLTWEGKAQTISQWSREKGIPAGVLRTRNLNGESISQIFRPVGSKKVIPTPVNF